MAFSTRGMLVFEEKTEGMCDFYYLAWNRKDFLVYLRWLSRDNIATYGTQKDDGMTQEERWMIVIANLMVVEKRRNY